MEGASRDRRGAHDNWRSSAVSGFSSIFNDTISRNDRHEPQVYQQHQRPFWFFSFENIRDDISVLFYNEDDEPDRRPLPPTIAINEPKELETD